MRKYFLIEFEGEDEDFPTRQTFFQTWEKCEAGIVELNRAEPINVEYVRAQDIETLLAS